VLGVANGVLAVVLAVLGLVAISIMGYRLKLFEIIPLIWWTKVGFQQYLVKAFDAGSLRFFALLRRRRFGM
jgi:hypothetical protein